MTDRQRTRVYAAEDQVRRLTDLALAGDGSIELFGSRIVLPLERKFGRHEEAQTYLDWLARQPWWRWDPVTVRPKRGLERAYYQGGVVHIPQAKWARNDWAMNEVVLLHEVAHHLARGVESHGPEFCGAMIMLFEEMIGPEWGLLLRVAFDQHGISVQPMHCLV